MKHFAKEMLRFSRLSNSTLLGWTILCVVAINSVWYGLIREAWLSPDAVCYLRMARNMIAGHGMNPDGLANINHGWFSVWPIGYPALIAALSFLLHVDVALASKLCAVLITGLILLILKRRFPGAFPLLALGLINFAFMKIFRSTWSEQPFLLCLLIFAIVMADVASQKWPSRKMIAMLTAASVGLFLFRYIGLFSIAVLLVFSCYRLAAERPRLGEKGCGGWQSGLYSIAIVVLSVGLMGGYLALNEVNAGSITGMRRPQGSECIGAFILTGVCAIARETQAVLFFIVLVGAFAFPLLIYKGGLNNLVPSTERYQVLCTACAATGIGYLVCIFFARFYIHVDGFGYRLLYPGTFMLMIAGVAWLANLSGIDFCQTFDRFPRRYILGYLLFVLILGSQVLKIESALRKWANIPEIEGLQPFTEVKGALVNKFVEIPPGSLVFVESYSSSDYLAGFIRPDLIVVPHRFGAYGESLRGFKEGVGVYVEKRVPVSFDISIAGQIGITEGGSAFRVLGKDANHLAISELAGGKTP